MAGIVTAEHLEFALATAAKFPATDKGAIEFALETQQVTSFPIAPGHVTRDGTKKNAKLA